MIVSTKLALEVMDQCVDEGLNFDEYIRRLEFEAMKQKIQNLENRGGEQ
jgi:hypothetical protein